MLTSQYVRLKMELADWGGSRYEPILTKMSSIFEMLGAGAGIAWGNSRGLPCCAGKLPRP
jgi:hypothetical protein